ncbi:MAG TPA: hypothetical protein VKL99_00730, partial [Candidatus Angelobacter sp.]|nr:hypothetical protein [Candidatus Angelobacter sp.]
GFPARCFLQLVQVLAFVFLVNKNPILQQVFPCCQYRNVWFCKAGLNAVSSPMAASSTPMIVHLFFMYFIVEPPDPPNSVCAPDGLNPTREFLA